MPERTAGMRGTERQSERETSRIPFASEDSCCNEPLCAISTARIKEVHLCRMGRTLAKLVEKKRNSRAKWSIPNDHKSE